VLNGFFEVFLIVYLKIFVEIDPLLPKLIFIIRDKVCTNKLNY
jgi:hypothetical protein